MNGNYLQKILNERMDDLQKIINSREKSLSYAPQGSLRINIKGKKIDYYHYDANDAAIPAHGRYIGRNSMDFAEALAQKAYDKNVLKCAKEEFELIEKLTKTYERTVPEKIYESLEDARKKLVNPIFLPDDEYIKQWEAKEYVGQGFALGAHEIYTRKGERVRSKSEKIIADCLNELCIPYRYECPLHLEPYGIIYPDFTILNINTRKEGYLEHFGLLDDEEYLDKALKKVDLYLKNGLRPGKELIITYESSQHVFDQRYLKELLGDYIALG